MHSFPFHATSLHLDWVLVVVVAWLLIGFAGVFVSRNLRFVATVLFPLGACCSILLAAVALGAAFANPEVAVLPLGLPQLPFHLRLDSLSAFFLNQSKKTVKTVFYYILRYLILHFGSRCAASFGINKGK